MGEGEPEILSLANFGREEQKECEGLDEICGMDSF
jgi:hypothetical protein